MASLIPYVEPAVNSVGNPISIQPRVIFDQAIDAGVINSSNFFIVKISKDEREGIEEYIGGANIVSDIVPARVAHRRINLGDEDTYTGKDYGDTGSAGQLYRSEIVINPAQPLPPNSNFATILSKHITLNTTFDPKPNAGNSGSGAMIAEGAYTGVVADTYTIMIVSSGGKYSSEYVWTSASGGNSPGALSASGKWLQLDSGVQIKFLDGSYDAGDSFTIEVRPKDEQVELYSWNFSTGLGAYQVPEDQRSGDVVGLPVIDSNNPPAPADTQLLVEAMFPDFAATNVKVGNIGHIVLGSVVFKTKTRTSDFNGKKIAMLDGGIAGSEVVMLNSDVIEITIEDKVSTAQQVVDAFNASALVNIDLEADTSTPAASQKSGISGRITNGVDENKIIITFSEDINAATLTDRVRVTSQPIFPAGEEVDLYFTTVVSGKTLTLTLLD